MFDPCGTRKLEGEEILKRLAEYLGVNVLYLKEALTRITAEIEGCHKNMKFKCGDTIVLKFNDTDEFLIGKTLSVIKDSDLNSPYWTDVEYENKKYSVRGQDCIKNNP